MTEQTGDQLPPERIQHSMPFDLGRVRQIVSEVDAEAEAEKSAEPVTAPFEEVVPVLKEEAPCQLSSENKNEGGWSSPCSIASMVLMVVGVVAGAYLGVKHPGDHLFGVKALDTASVLIGGGGAGWFAGALSALLLHLAVFGMAIVCSDAIGDFWVNPLPSKIISPITNTALGFVPAVKATAVGIGYAVYGVGVGLYYVVTNQLMPGRCKEYAEALAMWDGSGESAFPYLTIGAHFAGVAGSIVAVCLTDGTPLTDKLIFGWWGFYILNIFYLIGSKVRGIPKNHEK